MLTDTLKLTIRWGSCVAATAFLATTALAQMVVETPQGNTAVIADPALQPRGPVGTVAVPAYPLPAQLDNDTVVIEALLSQGFSDIHILRNGPIMTVEAVRDAVPTELVYSVANGTLISVDGVEMRNAGDSSSNGGSAISESVLGGETGNDEGSRPGDTDSGPGTGAGTDGTGAGTGGTAGDSGEGSESGSDGDSGGDGGTGGASGSDGASGGGAVAGG